MLRFAQTTAMNDNVILPNSPRPNVYGPITPSEMFERTAALLRENFKLFFGIALVVLGVEIVVGGVLGAVDKFEKAGADAFKPYEEKFGALHGWINDHLADDISLPALAREAGMSERSFSRHYAEATGLTPARAVERLRVEAARRLLSDSRLPVKRVAQRCGFGSEETMRRSFLRLLATTPQDYRARFSS